MVLLSLSFPNPPPQLHWILATICFRLYVAPRKLCRSPTVTMNKVCTLWHYISDGRVTDSSSVSVQCAFPPAWVYTSCMLSCGQAPLVFLPHVQLGCAQPPSLCGHQISNFLFSLSYLLGWINKPFIAMEGISSSLARLLACLLIVYSMFI